MSPQKAQHGYLAPGLLPPFSYIVYLRIYCFNSKMVLHGGEAAGGGVTSSQMKKQNLPFQEGFNNLQLSTQQNWTPLHSRASKTEGKKSVKENVLVFWHCVSNPVHMNGYKLCQMRAQDSREEYGLSNLAPYSELKLL